jgi:hypothetical protein
MKLDDLLKEYGETLTAPVADFGAVLAESRRRRNRKWMAGVVGLAAAACLVWMLRMPKAAPVVAVASARPAPVVEVAKLSTPGVIAVSRPVMRRAAPVREELRFVEIASTSLLPQPQNYRIVRVSVNGERLMALGVLRPNQTIQPQMLADVLIGDDGIARAVRVMAKEY